MRDQYAFNMLLKSKPLRRVNRTRAFLATNGDHGQLLLGILPLSRFLNGHTYFVQHAHTLPGAAQPVSVHMTYQVSVPSLLSGVHDFCVGILSQAVLLCALLPPKSPTSPRLNVRNGA